MASLLKEKEVGFFGLCDMLCIEFEHRIFCPSYNLGIQMEGLFFFERVISCCSLAERMHLTGMCAPL